MSGGIRRTIGVMAAVAAVVGSYAAVRTGSAQSIDERARLSIARRRHRGVDRAVTAATDLGSLYGLAGVVITLTARGRHRAAVDVAVSGLAAWSAAQSAKSLLHRERPYELGTADRLIATPAGTSWPSGHAAVMAAMAASLSDDGVPALMSRWSAVGAVGASRLYVGVHHLTDVIAGWGIGVLCAATWRVLRPWR